MNTAVALLQLNLSEAPCKIKLAMKQRERDVLSEHKKMMYPFLPFFFFFKDGRRSKSFLEYCSVENKSSLEI